MFRVASPRSHRGRGSVGWALLGAALLFGAAMLTGTINSARATALPGNLASLKTVRVPEPPNLDDFVADKDAAIQLGKALFWDMQVGSDGIQACASCHFVAGADNRARNQISPGLNAGDTSFSDLQPAQPGFQGGPNYKLKGADFPFHRLADPNDRNSAVLFDTNDVVSSQGVFLRDFVGINYDGYAEDICKRVSDPVFNLDGLNTRRVEPRNAPTVINAVFNFRNFWDGRANNDFNGVNPFGQRDTGAQVWKSVNGQLQPVSVVITFGSLASQAVGPPLSPFEMSCANRTFADVGRKLLALQPLAQQEVHPRDSVLGRLANYGGRGLAVGYDDLIMRAFDPEWWELPGQMEQNFSLFFGLSVQLYEATLVADDTPFDRFLEGKTSALTPDQKAGLDIFTGQGKCALCHGGPELTNASVANVVNERLERMIMGDGGIAVYDNGFYNIGVRPTADDLGVGGTDPFGNPLSETGFCQNFIQQHPNQPCPIKNVDALGRFENTSIADLIEARPDENIPAGPLLPQERINVKGAFKTPGLRNVELTAPYFHNGGMATLEQVVDFYNRGADFAQANQANLDPDITTLGLTETQKKQLVAFLHALTDERVRFEQEPFDHPSLCVPYGHSIEYQNGYDGYHLGSKGYDAVREAADKLQCIPAIGARGRGHNDPAQGFLSPRGYGW